MDVFGRMLKKAYNINLFGEIFEKVPAKFSLKFILYFFHQILTVDDYVGSQRLFFFCEIRLGYL